MEVRKRKFYATTHTLITEMVRRGINLKKIANYGEISVAMIEQHCCVKSELDPDSLQEQPTQSKHPEQTEEVLKLAEKPLHSLASPTGFEPVSPA